MTTSPLVWLNGTIAEEAETRISPFDRGFLWGDGVYEITPAFAGRAYRLADHLDRLFRSLAYLQIVPERDKAALMRATEAYLDANAKAGRLADSPMYRLGHWVTRGPDSPSMAAPSTCAPTPRGLMATPGSTAAQILCTVTRPEGATESG